MTPAGRKERSQNGRCPLHLKPEPSRRDIGIVPSLAVMSAAPDRLINVDTHAKLLCHLHVLALTIYIAVSLLLVGWPVLAHPDTVHVGLGKDPSVMMWCMVWWP